MNNRIQKKIKKIAVIGMVGCFFISTLALSGCESLRKKFTRKKKKDSIESQDIPIFEPVDYPKKVYTSEERYRQSFSLWRAWHREMSESLGTKDNAKRQIYLINQVISSLSQLTGYLVDEKATILKAEIAKLEQIKSDISSSVPVRSGASRSMEAERIERTIKSQFVYTKIQKYLKE